MQGNVIINKGVSCNIVAFPSVSSSLHSLPQATNIQLHPNMYAQRAAESEAKVSTTSAFSLHAINWHLFHQLRKGLSNTQASFTPAQALVYRKLVNFEPKRAAVQSNNSLPPARKSILEIIRYVGATHYATSGYPPIAVHSRTKP